MICLSFNVSIIPTTRPNNRDKMIITFFNTSRSFLLLVLNIGIVTKAINKTPTKKPDNLNLVLKNTIIGSKIFSIIFCFGFIKN